MEYQFRFKMIVTLRRWEDDEFIICIDDKPVGGVVTEKIGLIICDWLRISYSEIIDTTK